jgi:hypothetical protein
MVKGGQTLMKKGDGKGNEGAKNGKTSIVSRSPR